MTVSCCFAIAIALVGCWTNLIFAIVAPNNQKSIPRRTVFSTLSGTAATFFCQPNAGSAIANDEGESTNSFTTRLMVPGGSAVLKNTIVENELSSWTPPSLLTNLGRSRILASELKPIRQPLSPFADNELYYSSFLFGAWDVTAILKRKVYPFGTNYCPSRSLIEGSPRNRMEQVGDCTTYEMHFFSTIADDISNKITVNLGLGVPKSKIIADRAFNAISTSAAYKHLTPVQSVEWNPSQDPTRLTLSFGAGPVAEDMRPLGKRRKEIFITARLSEIGFDSETGAPVFCAAESSRSMTLAPGNVLVSDNEYITEYKVVDVGVGNHVTATSRVAVYLTPNPNSREGAQWQQVNGKAVAFFDYEIDMKRKLEMFESGESRACVLTPKDIIQCE